MKHLERNEKKYKDSIKKHWGKRDVIFTDSLHGKDERQLRENELLPGEISAVTFTVGCYTVKRARVYKGDGTLEELSEESRLLIMSPGFSPYVYHEISARHNADPNGVFKDSFISIWQYPELSTVNHWIDFICTAKGKGSDDDRATLFVLMNGRHWAELSPDGVVIDFAL